MAALDFPSSPTLNQQYAAPNGVTYQWDGAAWIVTGGPPGQLWTASGTTLVPTDQTKTVNVPATASTAAVNFGSQTPRGRVRQFSSSAVELSANRTDADTQDDNTKQSWSLGMDPTTTGAFSVSRKGAAGTWATYLTLDNAGNLSALAATGGNITAGYGVRANGNGGLRCQNTGTSAGDGYSNAIAFGWNGAMTARVDSTNVGTVNLTAPSDERLKTDVREDLPGLDAIRALRPVSFVYIAPGTPTEAGHPPGRHYGLIAQEAQPHVPLAVADDGSDEHWLSIDYRTLVPVLIRALQELAAKAPAADG
jgi:hypothetical protein